MCASGPRLSGPRGVGKQKDCLFALPRRAHSGCPEVEGALPSGAEQKQEKGKRARLTSLPRRETALPFSQGRETTPGCGDQKRPSMTMRPARSLAKASQRSSRAHCLEARSKRRAIPRDRQAGRTKRPSTYPVRLPSRPRTSFRIESSAMATSDPNSSAATSTAEGSSAWPAKNAAISEAWSCAASGQS